MDTDYVQLNLKNSKSSEQIDLIVHPTEALVRLSSGCMYFYTFFDYKRFQMYSYNEELLSAYFLDQQFLLLIRSNFKRKIYDHKYCVLILFW